MERIITNRAQETTKAWSKVLLTRVLLPSVVGVLIASPLRAQAQAGTADKPAFDVASIKVNKSGGGLVLMRPQAGGRYTATNVRLYDLITAAYQLKPLQLSGLPDWGNSTHFDIEAKTEGNPTRDEMNLMLQPLLADRFKLVVHHETRELSVFALVLSKPGKNGPGLVPHSADAKCVDPAGPPAPPRSDMPAPCGGLIMMNIFPTARITGNNVTMEMLAGRLSPLVYRIVVDQTGLSGLFDVNLQFAPLPPPGAPAGLVPSEDAASIFTALQEQFGLKLESKTAPVDILVIDHVEQPSEN